MRILLLGSGGREHALAWKLSQSPRVTKLLCGPGNPGTLQVASNVALAADVPAEVVGLARRESVDLVVVGPEAPLVAGVADALNEAGVPVFGPSRSAAAIEGSKAFAKEIMAAAKIATARHETFDDPASAEAYARRAGRVVVKADGLAAGKGVVVAQSADEAVAAVRSMSALGAAGGRLVLEEVLEGEEVSVIALCDGERYVLLPPAQDHKRVGEGDTGPNTGGMGAYCPVPFLSPARLEELGRAVIAPALAELTRRGSTFRGALYAGLMLTREGPKVLEFNCRMGDPETQALMMQVDEDLVPVLMECATGKLAHTSLAVGRGASVAVVAAAPGYPGSVRTGEPIEGLDRIGAGAVAFHAGTKLSGGRLVTSGGRVLSICARGSSLGSARDAAYQALSLVRFAGMHFRRDIGAKGLERAG